LALVFVLGVTAPARADVSPLPFVFGGFVGIAAILFAIAIAWGGIQLAWRSARKNRSGAKTAAR
jgi:hypothetical protein